MVLTAMPSYLIVALLVTSFFSFPAPSSAQSLSSCPISFEYQNYTIITSKCKGPNYTAELCCDALKEFACPFASYINNITTDCASTMFSYINLRGKYPPGLFANLCHDDQIGLVCEAESPAPSVPPESSSIESCPISFENQNYTILTSKCKGPIYNPELCCDALKEFACPFAPFLNNDTTNCASTMFSYINLYGKYPPGLFANFCRGDQNDLICEAESPVPSVPPRSSSPQSCPISFEYQNYTVITSKCRGPRFDPELCCSALKEFACPLAAYINNATTDCASTMFSYINLRGHYPPGLFASKCRGPQYGIICLPESSAPSLAPSFL